MATKKAVSTVKEETKKEDVKKPTMKYRLEMEDGTIIEGATSLRKFQPNIKNQVINSGYQVKINDGVFGGNIMIIDYTHQERM